MGEEEKNDVLSYFLFLVFIMGEVWLWLNGVGRELREGKRFVILVFED